jgi:DNA polymerase-3 subunit delta
MTFSVGWRFLIVSGCERWREADVKADLVPAIKAMPEETTIAFFASEDGRQQAPASLHSAVKGIKGKIANESLLKARELPAWAIAQATALSITLDGAGAQALIAQVGERQQRLLRELEKLALEYGPGAKIGVEEVSESAANSSELLVWGLVDAIVARDQRTALLTYLRLRDQNEDAGRLAVAIVRRLRDVTAIAERLEAGVSESQAAAGIPGGSYAAKRRMAEARSADPELLREATEALAALELASRGGSALDADTETLRVIERIAA